MPATTRYPRGILISCEVPWDEHHLLLEDVFREQVRRFLAFGFRGLYIFGTAGEGYAVGTVRFREIVRIFREETCGEGILPQVGVIGLSSVAIRERIDIAFELGFRVFQISLPCWGSLNDREVRRFFKDVCLPYPEARFLHYNVARTKRLLVAADYRQIVNEVPNLVATKNTSPDVAHTTSLMRVVPELQHFFGETTFPSACLYGECSLLSSFAPLFPVETMELFSHACNGRTEALFRAQQQLLSAVHEVIEPMLRLPLMDGAYDKALVRLGGLAMPLRLLSPYEEVPEEVFLECQRRFQSKYSKTAKRQH